MVQLSRYAPWGAWHPFAKTSPKSHKSFPHALKITARQARDIGLTDAEHERLTFRWPSDGPDRPLL